jgi:hypothetical protein
MWQYMTMTVTIKITFKKKLRTDQIRATLPLFLQSEGKTQIEDVREQVAEKTT